MAKLYDDKEEWLKKAFARDPEAELREDLRKQHVRAVAAVDRRRTGRVFSEEEMEILKKAAQTIRAAEQCLARGWQMQTLDAVYARNRRVQLITNERGEQEYVLIRDTKV